MRIQFLPRLLPHLVMSSILFGVSGRTSRSGRRSPGLRASFRRSTRPLSSSFAHLPGNGVARRSRPLARLLLAPTTCGEEEEHLGRGGGGRDVKREWIVINALARSLARSLFCRARTFVCPTARDRSTPATDRALLLPAPPTVGRWAVQTPFAKPPYDRRSVGRCSSTHRPRWQTKTGRAVTGVSSWTARRQ